MTRDARGISASLPKTVSEAIERVAEYRELRLPPRRTDLLGRLVLRFLWRRQLKWQVETNLAVHDALQRLAEGIYGRQSPSNLDDNDPDTCLLNRVAALERRVAEINQAVDGSLPVTSADATYDGESVTRTGRRRTEPRQAAVDAVPFWFHSIDVGDGVVTPGVKTAEFHEDEWARLRVPPLVGRTVLDIGAWDGRYSFAAEQAGAARVVSLDHYSWSVDWPTYFAYIHGIREGGGHVPDAATIPSAWRPESLPGKTGFDTARRLRNSNVEDVVLDFANDDLSSIGSFDVVLFAGVLYHLPDPVGALRQLYTVTKDVAVISTHAVYIDGFEHLALAEFFSHDQFAGDPTNWWAPNMNALRGWCEAAGFKEFEVIVGPDGLDCAAGDVTRYVAVVHVHPGSRPEDLSAASRRFPEEQ